MDFHKIYAATMDGKGEEGTYNFFSRRLGGQSGGQGIGHRGQLPPTPCHPAGAADELDTLACYCANQSESAQNWNQMNAFERIQDSAPYEQTKDTLRWRNFMYASHPRRVRHTRPDRCIRKAKWCHLTEHKTTPPCWRYTYSVYKE